jgi:ATP-dependent metalloprotease FtsH
MNKNLFYFFLFSLLLIINNNPQEPGYNWTSFSLSAGLSITSTLLCELFKTIYDRIINPKKNNMDLLLQKLKDQKDKTPLTKPVTNASLPNERFISYSQTNSEIKWNSIFLPKEIKEELLQYAKEVFTPRDPHDIITPNILVLYGLPGSNKTAIIKGLSNELNIPLLIVDPNLLDDNVYNKITIDSILEHVKNKGPFLVHIKNLERMSKNFLLSCEKYLQTRLNNPNILLTATCNNDFLVKDLSLNKNKFIKFMIIENPKHEERLQLITYILSLYKNLINIEGIDINYITNILNTCKQKDISLILEKTIEKKKLINNIKNNTNENETIVLTTNDILLEYKIFKKHDTIITGEKESRLNIGLTSINEFIIENPKVTFDEVIGLEHIKKELRFIADYFKNPEIYKKINIRMPKGILFKGPPGCGKTLMAKAIAGEAGITVISINGSDFIDKYVGQGAKKVREVFEIAKLYAPTIIFIDEIDAIGGKRSDNAEGGEKEYTQTLNALLTEIDGFSSTNNNTIVVASTNRDIETLDPALMRRFEEKYNFPLPTYKDRLEILKLYFKDIPVSDDVSLESITKKTVSFSGAELEYLVNQSKYIAINRMKELGQSLTNFQISEDDIIQAYNTISIGYEILNTTISENALFKTAVHESGHTLCMLLQKNYPMQFELVTITPRDAGDGTYLGFAQNFYKEEFKSLSKENLEQLIIVSFGGQVAEELIFNETYNGVTSDLNHASNIARSMVTQYGMAENLLYFSNDLKLSEQEKEAVEKILKNCRDKCKELLTANKHLLEKLSQKLLREKTLKRNDVIALLEIENNE